VRYSSLVAENRAWFDSIIDTRLLRLTEEKSKLA